MVTKVTKKATPAKVVKTAKAAPPAKAVKSVAKASPEPTPVVTEAPAEVATQEAASRERVVVFCDRLNQICDRRPSVIRKGRGRVNDIAEKFGIHYTTAYRLLNAEGLPNCELLWQLVDAFEVSESWLLGRGPNDVDDLLDTASVKINIFNPRSSDTSQFATIPSSQLPPGFDSSKLVYTRVTTEIGDEEDVVVRITAEAHEGKVHLFYDPTNETTYLRRINIDFSNDRLLCSTLGTAQMTILDTKGVVFGALQGAKGVSVVGPVVARVAYSFRGD